ncbi:MAG: phosphatidate cytidylyltransferase [Clostridiales bacterium]|nr:phosphatidate cytidylyltransferase [Clostridiales bacterium]
MKQRIITGTIFTIAVLALVLPAYYIPAILLVFTMIVTCFALYEMIKAAQESEKEMSAVVTIIGGFLSYLPLAIWAYKGTPSQGFTLYALVTLIYCFITTMIPPLVKEHPEAIRSGFASSLIVMYISFPIACTHVMMFLIPKGWFFVVIGLFAPWVSDTFAYFSGSFFGKTKIVPHISPKKTWEGCIGGALFTAILMTLFFAFVMVDVIEVKMPFPLYVTLAFVFGFVLSCVSQLGDWMASSIKRLVGIKDFGNLMPGHGGIMDRFDSAFFTLPVALGLAFVIHWGGGA